MLQPLFHQHYSIFLLSLINIYQTPMKCQTLFQVLKCSNKQSPISLLSCILFCSVLYRSSYYLNSHNSLDSYSSYPILLLGKLSHRELKHFKVMVTQVGYDTQNLSRMVWFQKAYFKHPFNTVSILKSKAFICNHSAMPTTSSAFLTEVLSFVIQSETMDGKRGYTVSI